MLAKLLERRAVTKRDTLYCFECPELARKAKPGQFVELLLNDASADPFLRRPISIFDCDGEKTLTLLVRTVGRGTEYMTRWEPGTGVDILGPLGHGFHWAESDKRCLLIGGGIGLAPLNYLARVLLAEGKQVELLFLPKRDDALLAALPCREELTIHFAENRGAVGGVLDALLNAGTDRVFCCGPEGLLEAVAAGTLERGVPCQLSMERRMACGIGICLGCAIAIRTGDGVTYKKVCKDGPVFEAEEVAFHEEP